LLVPIFRPQSASQNSYSHRTATPLRQTNQSGAANLKLPSASCATISWRPNIRRAIALPNGPPLTDHAATDRASADSSG